jgi:hypothetical protein
MDEEIYVFEPVAGQGSLPKVVSYGTSLVLYISKYRNNCV